MKHFYLVENSRRGKLPGCKELISDYLGSKGAEISCTDGYPERKDIPDGTECVLVLGGDGTIMRLAGELYGLDIPLIGINVGRLGYLTSVSSEEEIIPMLDRLLNGEYRIENHYMLKGEWENGGEKHEEYALNDIVISRKGSLKTVNMNVAVNGELLNEYLADGIIVSTPTGSTAYNLSAGGPVLEVCSDMMVITPICPHAFIARSMVIRMDNEAEITVIRDKEDKDTFAEAAFDGIVKGGFDIDTQIYISKAEHTVPMIRLNGDSYFKTLRNKMNQIRG